MEANVSSPGQIYAVAVVQRNVDSSVVRQGRHCEAGQGVGADSRCPVGVVSSWRPIEPVGSQVAAVFVNNVAGGDEVLQRTAEVGGERREARCVPAAETDIQTE